MANDKFNLARYATENERLNKQPHSFPRIVFMGDSITEFWKILRPNFFNNPNYINRGISGQTTRELLVRFQQDVLDLKPTVVVLLAGINDIAQNSGYINTEETYENIVQMAMLSLKNNATVVLSSVTPAIEFPWRKNIDPVTKILEINTLLRLFAVKNNLTYVDYYTDLVDENKKLKAIYSNDGVHPNEVGYEIMEPLVEFAIETAVQKLLKKIV